MVRQSGERARIQMAALLHCGLLPSASMPISARVLFFPTTPDATRIRKASVAFYAAWPQPWASVAVLMEPAIDDRRGRG